MSRATRYPTEVRERAVRLVFDHEREYDSQWAAISSISAKLGMTAETLRKWVRAAETDQGLRPGLFTKACGYNLGDFATGNYPMGLRHRGLPCSPQELLGRNKKIVHSVRFWRDMDEPTIRAFFAQRRNAAAR